MRQHCEVRQSLVGDRFGWMEKELEGYDPSRIDQSWNSFMRRIHARYFPEFWTFRSTDRPHHHVALPFLVLEENGETTKFQLEVYPYNGGCLHSIVVRYGDSEDHINQVNFMVKPVWKAATRMIIPLLVVIEMNFSPTSSPEQIFAEVGRLVRGYEEMLGMTADTRESEAPVPAPEPDDIASVKNVEPTSLWGAVVNFFRSICIN